LETRVSRRQWIARFVSAGLALSTVPAAEAGPVGERDIELVLRGAELVVRVRVGLREVLATKNVVATADPSSDHFTRAELDPFVVAYAALLPGSLRLKLDGVGKELVAVDSALEAKGDRPVKRAADVDAVHAYVELRAPLSGDPKIIELVLPPGDPAARNVVTLRRDGDTQPLAAEVASPGATVKLALAPTNVLANPTDDPRGATPVVGDRERPIPTFYAIPLALLSMLGVFWWLWSRRPIKPPRA
jgi:hypothetical protein